MGTSGSKRVRSPEAPSGEKRKDVRVWLLGGFRLSVGSRTITQDAWRLRKAAALVKLLALAPGHRMHREQAMELLWPDLDKRAASNNLRQTLHAARRVLDPVAGSLYLVSEDDRLVLCPQGQLWVDVEAFEHAATSARRSGDPAAYRAAIELYTGELLPADIYEEWTEVRRQELRGIFLSLLVELAELYEERGESEPAADALRRALVEEPTLEEAHAGFMRLYALSGKQQEALRQYERLGEILSKELGAEPEASTRHLRELVAEGRFPPEQQPSPGDAPSEVPPDARKHNLPASRTSLVGWDRELIEAKRALAMTRLLTVIGVGGSGKTRFGLEVARELVGAYPDGVWLVEFAPLLEAALVPQTVAYAVGVPEQPGRSPLQTLREALGEKELLLLLDNCEHLVEAAANLVDSLLDACAHLRILATSREALRVEGETRWPVPPLSLPDLQYPVTVEELEGYESARLFLERARSRNPAFVLTQENARAVAEVCQRVDGIPLAIELAATRVGVLSVEQIAERLSNSLRLLTGGRTAVARHRTLEGTLGWSHDLLFEKEQALFRRLSVFSGGCALEAAAAVGSVDGLEEEDVLDLLSNLVDKSLVVAEAGRDRALRYRMLEPVRQYARQQLETTGEGDAVLRRHADFFLALAQEAEPELTGTRQREWLEILEAEHDNFRAALSWSLDAEPETTQRLAVALARFWETRSYYSEGRTWLEAALRRHERTDAAARAKALTETGTFAWHQGAYEQAITFHAEALALYRELGDEHGVAFALMCLGTQEFEKGDLDRAAPLYEEALSLSRIIGDKRTSAMILGNLGQVEWHRGNHGRAIALNVEALSLLKDLEDTSMVTEVLSVSGRDTAYHGAYETAARFIEEGLLLARDLRNGYCVAHCLEGLAALATAKANGVRAARLWGAADALREAVGAPLAPVDLQVHERNVAGARAQIDEASWEAAWAEGKAMTLEVATEYALLAEEPTLVHLAPERPLVDELASLTRREREVAALVSRGLTNRQIASELVVSEYTVNNHVSSILKKLNLHSREQVTALLTER